MKKVLKGLECSKERLEVEKQATHWGIPSDFPKIFLLLWPVSLVCQLYHYILS